MYIDLNAVTTISSLGGGPIGAGWAAHFLSKGFKVKKMDVGFYVMMSVVRSRTHICLQTLELYTFYIYYAKCFFFTRG